MEEEIERMNSERVKVLSQLYRNDKALKPIKAESKRIKEEMKRLYAEYESESESESESEAESESESESLEEEMKRLYEESESESLKEALKRLNAESKSLKQERDRLKSIYQDLTKKKMEVEVEEEIERMNSERIKVLSQLYCNDEALEGIKAEFKRIKSPLKSKEMKQLSALSLSESESLESLKEALKRLNAESKSLKQERDRLRSIYEDLK